MLAFLEALYRRSTGEPVHLIFDEADRWAPERIVDKEGEVVAASQRRPKQRIPPPLYRGRDAPQGPQNGLLQEVKSTQHMDRG